MINNKHIIMIINTLNVKLILLTLRYDVVMMYWNYIKNDV
jgi:hypothetical protein